MSVQPVGLGPFTGGVNLVDPEVILSPQELSQCKNVRIGVRGNFYKRPGYGIHGATATKLNGNNFVNLDLRYYKSDGTKLRISAAGGKLAKWNDTTGVPTDISINGSGASMNSSNLADWMVYKDRLYITDGTQPQRYNGTDDIFAGHTVPAAPTLAQTTGGSLTLLGAYQYLVTSVAGNMGEGSKGSTASITLTGSNNRVNLTNILAAAAKFEETTKKIYRTKAGGTIFYFLVEIATATTTYNDLIADTVLGAEYVAVHDPPADARFCIMGHDERAYWAGRSGLNASLVDVSEIGFPDRCRDTDFVSIANNDGDTLTGMGLTPGGIIFFKKTSMWLQREFGFGLINIYPKEKKGAGVGTTSHFSIVSTPIRLIFLSQRGEIYRFDGTNIEEIGRKIASEFKGMTQSAMSRVIACYHDYRYIISYDYRGLKGYNSKTLEYDTITNKWDGPFENGDFYTPSYYSVWDSALDRGELGWGEANAATGSYVYTRTEFTETDNGHKFISTVQFGPNSPTNLAEVKSYKVFIHGEISGDTTLVFTHIDEAGNRTSVNMNTPVSSVGSILGGNDVLGTTFILGGSVISNVAEGNLGPCRSRVPTYEITDSGTATRFKINIMTLLADELPLK